MDLEMETVHRLQRRSLDDDDDDDDDDTGDTVVNVDECGDDL
jgi:hypothetical protein